jgi:hypothetical protein
LAAAPDAALDLQGALIIALFLVMIGLMYTRTLSALLALPILGVGVALIGALDWGGALDALRVQGLGAMWTTLQMKPILVDQVIGKGATKLSTAYTIAIIGGMLAILIKEKRIAETLIKYAAELSGDNPVTVALLMAAVVALLFTSMGGLGAIIMTGTIVFPVMMSLGIAPLTAAGIYLMAFSAGGTLNPGNWALYEEALHLSADKVQPFALITMGLYFATVLVFVTLNLRGETRYWATARAAAKETGVRPIALLAPIVPIVLAFRVSALTGMAVHYVHGSPEVAIPAFVGFGDALGQLGENLPKVLSSNWFLIVAGVMAALVVVRALLGGSLMWAGPLTLLGVIYLLGVLVDWVSLPRLHRWASYWDAHIGGWDYVGAFIAGVIFTFVATYRRGAPNIQHLTKAIIVGAESVMPAVLLMIGLGIVLEGMWIESVRAHLGPYVQCVVPSTPLGYVVTFSCLAFLALYRGPLNIWGLGLGVAGLIYASGEMGALPIMALFMSVGAIQSVCDPTNTHSIWIASYIGEDVMRILKKTLPYVWAMAIVGLIIAAILYHDKFGRDLELDLGQDVAVAEQTL